MRSVLGWLRRFALTAIALAAVALAAVLIAAHTGWGREQLRRKIEQALQGAFPGAHVAALEGSVLGTLTLHGVEIDGIDQRPLATAGTLRAAIALWPIVSRTVRIDRLVADDVHAYVRDVPPPPAPGRPAEPSPWRIELPALAIHRATVEIERGGIALGELEVTGALSAAAGRVELDGAAHGRWSRAGGAPAPLAARGKLAIDGGVRVSDAHVALGDAAIDATALVLDAEHPRGTLTASAPRTAIAQLAPELGGAVPGDVTASIELAADGPATRLLVQAAAGDARLWAAVRGDPARRTAAGLVSGVAIDLAPVTRGRLRGRGNVLAALEAGAEGVRGAVIAFGDVRAPDLPVRRAGMVLFGSLGDARALVLGSGDDGLELSAWARGHRGAGSVVLDDARATASARAVALPIAEPDANAGPARCRRITGALAVSARARGTLAPAPDLVVTGVAEATRAMVTPAGGTTCAALATAVSTAARTGKAEVRAIPVIHDTARVSIGALRSPFVLRIAPGKGDHPPEITLTGDPAATAVAVDDLTIATAGGSFALGVLPELRLDRAQVAGAGIRRAGSLLGDGRVDLARRGATFGVAATARPAAGGLTITTAASVAKAGSGYLATLDASSVALPDGTVWAGRGGSVAIAAPTDPTRTAIALDGLSLRHGDAQVALSGRYAVPTGDLAAHVDADRVDASLIDAQARGIGRGTLELARRGGQWQADGAIAITGLAASLEAPPVDVTTHVGLVRGRATLDAHATGPGLGGIELALDADAPRDPLDAAAWRRLDRDAIHRAAITARQVSLSGLAARIGSAARGPGSPGGPGRMTGTVDGTVDLAPAALRGGFTVRGVELPFGAVEGDLAIAPHDGDLDAHAAARLAGVAAADLTARFTVPQHPLDPAIWPAIWQRGGRDLLREAQGTLGDVAFDPALLARLGLASRLAEHGVAASYRGRARAQLALGAAAGDARLAVDLTGVTGGALAAPVSSHLVLTAGPTGSHLRAELSGTGPRGALDLGVLEADVPMTVDRWLDEPAAVLSAPLTARWTLPATPLAPVLAVFGRSDLEAGTLEGTATIRGTVRTPIVPSARLVARDVQIARRPGGPALPAIRELEAQASWGGASGTVEITGREATGGELHAVASGRPDALAAATGTAQLRRFDLAPIAALLPGALSSAAGTVDGDLALQPAGQVTGKLHVAGGALPLAPAIGTVRDATADLASDGRTITARLLGQLGRGTIDLTAHAPAGDPAAVTAELLLDKVSLIAARRPRVTARVTAQLHRVADQLRGDVKVERGSIALPEHAGAPLLDATVPDDLVLAGTPAAPRGPRAPAHPWLVVDVSLGDTWVEAPKLSVDIGFLAWFLALDVGFRGKLHSDRLEVSLGDAIGVRGKIDIASADLEIPGRHYTLDPSYLLFEGTTDPRLSIDLNYRFPEMTLEVAVRGTASRPDGKLSSDVPGYSTDALLAFFLGSEPSTEASSPGRDQIQTSAAVAAAGARLVSAKLGRQLDRVLPFKLDLSCEPEPAAITATSASCTGSTSPWRWLFIAARKHFQPRTDENTGDVQLQLRLGDQLLLEGTGGDRGYYGADLLWRHRW